MTQPVSADARRIEAAALRTWGTRCLVAAGMGDADAAQLAGSLVQTSLWGIDSHGIALLPHYLDRLANGTIKARPALVVRRTAAATAMVDADQGHGIVVAHRAMDEAIAIAKGADGEAGHGVGAVGVRDASHCGAVGLYARQAANAGCVGIALTHANSVAVPHGGARAFLGTNPIAIAVPRAGARPVCLDMATTSIPWNRVRNARREGHALPDDVAVDAAGSITTDPHAAAAVMPLGGAAFGHKGYALALMIDLLCGPLLGNPFGPHIPSMFEAIDEPRRLGAFFIAIDPERFGGRDALAVAAARMAAELAAEPGAPRMPSDPEHDAEAERARDGVPIEAGLADLFRVWSARLGLPAPL